MSSPESYQHSQAVLPTLDQELIQHVGWQYSHDPQSLYSQFDKYLRRFNPTLHDIVDDLPFSFGVVPPLHGVAIERATVMYGLLHRQMVSDKAVGNFAKHTGGELTTADLPDGFMQRERSLGSRMLRGIARLGRPRLNLDRYALPMVTSPHIPQNSLAAINVRHALDVINDSDPALSFIIDGNIDCFPEAASLANTEPQQRIAIGHVSLAVYELLDNAERTGGRR